MNTRSKKICGVDDDDNDDDDDDDDGDGDGDDDDIDVDNGDDDDDDDDDDVNDDCCVWGSSIGTLLFDGLHVARL